MLSLLKIPEDSSMIKSNVDKIPTSHIIVKDQNNDEIIHPSIINGRNVAIDCTAWNFTNLLSFPSRRILSG